MKIIPYFKMLVSVAAFPAQLVVLGLEMVDQHRQEISRQKRMARWRA